MAPILVSDLDFGVDPVILVFGTAITAVVALCFFALLIFGCACCSPTKNEQQDKAKGDELSSLKSAGGDKQEEINTVQSERKETIASFKAEPMGLAGTEKDAPVQMVETKKMAESKMSQKIALPTKQPVVQAQKAKSLKKAPTLLIKKGPTLIKKESAPPALLQTQEVTPKHPTSSTVTAKQVTTVKQGTISKSVSKQTIPKQGTTVLNRTVAPTVATKAMPNPTTGLSAPNFVPMTTAAKLKKTRVFDGSRDATRTYVDEDAADYATLYAVSHDFNPSAYLPEAEEKQQGKEEAVAVGDEAVASSTMACDQVSQHSKSVWVKPTALQKATPRVKRKKRTKA